jgi:hypothetical protein
MNTKDLPGHFKVDLVIQNQNNWFEKVYHLKQNIATVESLTM